MSDTHANEPNPYAPPAVDERAAPYDGASLDDPRMPGSVIVALVSVAIVVLFNLLMVVGATVANQGLMVLYLVTLLIGVVVLIGLARRNRLAWQWGRIMGMLGAVLATLTVGMAVVGMVMAVQSGELDEVFAQAGGRAAMITGIAIGVAMLVLPTLCLWVAFFALGRPSARRWFRLVCPSCESRRVRAVGFLYSRARCRRCQAVW